MDARKGIRRKSDSGIEIDFSYRGRRCRETLKLAPTRANMEFARRKREAILHDIALDKFDYAKHFPSSRKAGSMSGRGIETVEHALDSFLRSAQKRCEDSTVRDYKSAVKFHLKPAFGKRLVCELTAADIREWVGGLTISGKRVNNVLVPLRAILGQAFEDGLIDRNPAARIKNLKHRFAEPDPLEPDEVEKLLGACQGQVQNLFRFAIWSGVRTSELIALEWGDIDWNRGIARIRRASVRKVVKGPKTEAGGRDIKLLPGAFEALQAQKPSSFVAGGRIFLNPRTGKPWETDGQIRKTAWWPAVRRAEIRDRNPYQTRHTFASLCLTAGEDIAWVAHQLGHKSISMTLKRYARYIVGLNESGGEKFSRLLSQSSHRSTANA